MSRVLVDSGIGYLGNIPSEWNIFRIKNAFKCKKNIVNDNWSNTQLLSLTTSGVKEKDIDNPNGKLPDSFNGYQYVEINNIIMCLFDLDCSAVFSGISKYKGMISPAYKVLECKEIMNPDYAGYYFNYISYDRKYMHYSKNIRYTLNYDEFSSLPMLIPPLEEQKKISIYLDKQCAKIDEIINDNNREVELLQEYKSNFISKVIEKGMTGGVKKIDNKYISSIPNNSSLVMLKQITNLITDGTHQTPTYISDGIPFLSIKDISSGIIDLSNCKYISNEEHMALSKHANIEKNDLLFCRIGTLGKSIVVEEKFLPFDIFVSLGLIKIKKEIINPYYLKYVMESNYYKEYIEVVKIDGGVSAAKFNLSSVKSSPIILPKLDEQNLIVKYLNKQCSKLDQVIKYRKQIIEKLEEYKKSLIYECVTGKREV